MITLATLPQATKQDVFNQVVTHLLTQNVRCVDNHGTCQYRADGKMCAAGCLMADDEYLDRFENQDWHTLVTLEDVPHQHENLILELQATHDSEPVEHWPQKLAGIACWNGLTLPKELIDRLDP